MKMASSAHFSLCPVFWWFLVLLFDTEGGGDMVLENVRLSLNYTFLHSPHIEHGSSVKHIFIVDSHTRPAGV
jgi:hypothetical protein